ncbi:MAG: GHKL domain-containing protein [Erysipelotrichaceae bacterium]|nr:GHKL domain-containing protein [Erysipelotrichaceae bacterium]
MHFFNFFFGFLSQVIPCAMLCLLPAFFSSKANRTFSSKHWAVIGTSFLGSGLLFSASSSFIAWNYINGRVSIDFSSNLINLIFIGIVLVYFIVFFIKSSMDATHTIFLFLFSFNYGMLISVFSMIYSSLTPYPGKYKGLPYKTSGVIFLVAANLLLFPLFAYMLQRLWKIFPKASQKSGRSMRLFFLLPVPFIILTLICSLLGSDTLFSDPLFSLLLVGFLLAQLTFYWFLANFVSHTVQISMQERQYQIALENCHSMQKHLESMRVFRHEFNRHLTTISGYLATHREGDAQTYILNLLAEPSMAAPLAYCHHPLVNAVLHSFLPSLEQQGAEVTYKIEIPDELPLPDNHLTGLLYNMLQNASEACMLTLKEPDYPKKPYLHLNICIRQEHLVFLCTNSCCQPISRNLSGNILSSKKDSGAHGLGLQIMQNIVQIHDGILEYHEKADSFELSAALHLDFSDSSKIYQGGAL